MERIGRRGAIERELERRLRLMRGRGEEERTSLCAFHIWARRAAGMTSFQLRKLEEIDEEIDCGSSAFSWLSQHFTYGAKKIILPVMRN